MKYTIKKLQQGGGFATFTPVIYQQPVQQESKSESKTESKKRNISSLLDDKIFEDLLGKGLSNDVNNLVNELIKLESSNSDFPFVQSGNRNTALRLIGKINELKQNKTKWDDAYNTSKSQGGLNEVAVDSYGGMYAKDNSGKVYQISYKDYLKNKEKVKVLSVAELLNEREYNPQLIGQNGIFDVANNSIGLSKITDNIRTMISALGKEEYNDSKFYSKEQVAETLKSFSGKKATNEEVTALQQFKQLLEVPSDYYKVVSKNSTERNHLDKALNYIWKTLGDGAQQKLTATAVLNGESDPRKFIYDMLTAETDISHEIQTEPQALPGSSSSDGSKNEKSLTQFQLWHKDKLMNVNNTFALNDPKMASMFRGVIGGVSPVILPNGDNIGMTTVKNILNLGYNQIVKGNEVYFGNKKVSNADLNNIIYDGQDAAKVYMPVNGNGDPDYESLAKFKDIYAVYEANKDNWSIAKAEKYFNNEGYKIKIDEKYEDGQLVKVIRDNNQVKPFLVMYGYTNDATDLVDGNEDWLTKLSSNEEDYIVPQLEQIWTIGKDKKAKNMTPSAFWNIEEYYKGMVAIPYKPEATAIVDAMVGQGPREKVSSIGDVQRNINYSSNQPLNTNTSGMSLKNM